MKILITNDDGIEAKGINILAERLEKDGHEIYVVAPDSNRSAVSHHISMWNTNTLLTVYVWVLKATLLILSLML